MLYPLPQKDGGREEGDGPGVVVAELEMTRFNKRSTDRSVLMSYFDARREAAQQMDDFYGRIMYRVFPSCDDGIPFRWNSVVCRV